MKLEYNESELKYIEELKKKVEETGCLHTSDELDGHGPIRPICGTEIGREFSINFKVADPVRVHFFITQLLYGIHDNEIDISMQDFFGISDVQFNMQSNKQIVIDHLESIIEDLRGR